MSCQERLVAKTTYQPTQSCAVLVQEFQARGIPICGEKLRFDGVNGRDVYNTTAPFKEGADLLIAGRVEPLRS